MKVTTDPWLAPIIGAKADKTILLMLVTTMKSLGLNPQNFHSSPLGDSEKSANKTSAERRGTCFISSEPISTGCGWSPQAAVKRTSGVMAQKSGKIVCIYRSGYHYLSLADIDKMAVIYQSASMQIMWIDSYIGWDGTEYHRQNIEPSCVTMS